ncbi:MAG: hypothetical protein E3K32_06745 [wastewater metagenome]|nr:hypothetical protein [Candidatus Loosdrechtia aerotolerans]
MFLFPHLNINEITLTVEMELLTDEAATSHLIDVRTENGIVTLSGSVNNLLARGNEQSELQKRLKVPGLLLITSE